MISESQIGFIKGIKFYGNLTYELTAEIYNRGKSKQFQVNARQVSDFCKDLKYAHIPTCTPSFAALETKRFYNYKEKLIAQQRKRV